jgi:hypothetical protein
MDIQIIIVAVIIILALLFVGKNVWRKAKSFAPKGDCGADCGCDAKGKAKKSLKPTR